MRAALALGIICAIPAGAAAVDRPTAEALYAQIRADSAVPTGWTGASDTCTVGEESPESLAATLRTVNAVRAFMGLAPVTFDPALNRKALSAALIMTVRGTLDHFPTPEWRCWSADGAEGAANSNLHRGTPTGSTAVLSYMRDRNVIDVGHRRHISRPTVRVMGSGSTDRVNALYVLAPSARWPAASTPVTWPAAGWFPAEYVPPVWTYMPFPSENAPKPYFGDATVSVTRDGVPIAVERDMLGRSANDSDIGFIPEVAATRDDGRDHTFVVRIDGVRDLLPSMPLPPIEYTVYTLGGPGSPVVAPRPDPAPAAEGGEGVLSLAASRVGRKFRARIESDTAGSATITLRATTARARARSLTVTRALAVGVSTVRITLPVRLVAPGWRLTATVRMGVSRLRVPVRVTRR